ncbi:MAG: NgoFVII family restriction endonuclease [Deltaproteobacteria bacterium HGW-Deltaproteobacteria-18]|nr:MAG: NgoFVII family restriction endonuclease [Deltaproteobacteria bacterium HGW-Deltaproteobacteria-18]
MRHPVAGIYDALLDELLRESLDRHPELRTIFGKIDQEELPSRYAAFVAKVLEQALREESDPLRRLALCNEILGQVASQPGKEHLRKHCLIPEQKPLLLEITPPNFGKSGIPRPHTSLSESSLFTGSPQEPQLAHELNEEMRSADGVDILLSFIKWSGLRLLMASFEDLRARRIPVRVITTSYMGASDARAVEWLAALPNVQVRVSYDTERTRLHAKAYHFLRHTGFSTAYIGSANMSHAAITSGLEWNLKITAQDMGHILEKFSIEFETYWNSREFIPFDPQNPALFRTAIARARNPQTNAPTVFFDLCPHPFQERILEALHRERSLHDRWKNLVIAATGTGKTVITAFDFKRFYEENGRQAKLLFVAHRQEILQQAMATFRQVLRDQNFGELQVGTHEAGRMEHLFCSINMLSTRRLWELVGPTFYDYIVIDEAHHGVANSYRPVFDHFDPKVLLGLTATPERMDGGNVAADFGNRFAAEIRLPEALEEKLLCPFHYFGVADPIAINGDQFWSNGRYDESALENVYVLDEVRAQQRLETIISALHRYEPELHALKGIGFCVTIRHAQFMAEQLSLRGLPSAAFVSGLDGHACAELLNKLKNGALTFLFTVDKLSEGVEVPEVNTILFLRPTESLTVFLQQLGRGLRHAPEKDCLTVLDFVGQAHRRFRADSKFKALLPRHRFAIDKEVELDFPHLPAGCSIQLDRLSREYVLENIKENLRRLAVQVPERLQSFTSETDQDLTFSNFIRHHDYEPEVLLARETWSGWKAKAQLGPIPTDPDFNRLKKALIRAAFVSGPHEAALYRRILSKIRDGNMREAVSLAGESAFLIYYRIWGDRGEKAGIATLEEAFSRLAANPTICADLDEILAWSQEASHAAGQKMQLPYACPLELHAFYGIKEIQAALGKATLESAGQTGVGVLHFAEIKTYALLVTFQKTEKEFSPSTMYADYPISRELLHWESQANTAQHHADGQNLIHHKARGYTILVFARGQKKRNGVTAPFTCLGPVQLIKFESERPIIMTWCLDYPMPVEMFEDNKKGG